MDKNLSVGVEILDEQHKTLINVLNDLYSAINKNKEATFYTNIFANFWSIQRYILHAKKPICKI